MAQRFAKGKLLDVVPVAWQRDYHDGLLKVHFKKPSEVQDYASRGAPFMVAVAKAKDYDVHPHQIDFFTCVFRVKATGEILSEHTVQTRVLDRVRA